MILTGFSVSPCLTRSRVLSGFDFAENGVFAVEPIGRDVGNKELAAVGAGAGIGHGKRADFMLVRIAFKFVFEVVTGTAAAGARGISP